MFKKLITLSVLACFLFYTGCASIISNVQVDDSEYNEIMRVEKVFVTTKDGKRYEVINFKFTETHLVGQEVRDGTITEPIQISLSDIDHIEILGVRDAYGKIITYEEIKANLIVRPASRTVMTVLGVIGWGALGFVLGTIALFWIETARENQGYYREEPSDIGQVIFIGEIGMIVLGGYFGFKGGKNNDFRKAIEKIQLERNKHYSRPLKEKDGTIIISDRVGAVIDLEERNRYGLFHSTEGFQSAVLYKEPDGRYTLKVTYIDETIGIEKIQLIYQDESTLYRIRAQIEDF